MAAKKDFPDESWARRAAVEEMRVKSEGANERFREKARQRLAERKFESERRRPRPAARG